MKNDESQSDTLLDCGDTQFIVGAETLKCANELEMEP